MSLDRTAWQFAVTESSCYLATESQKYASASRKKCASFIIASFPLTEVLNKIAVMSNVFSSVSQFRSPLARTLKWRSLRHPSLINYGFNDDLTRSKRQYLFWYVYVSYGFDTIANYDFRTSLTTLVPCFGTNKCIILTEYFRKTVCGDDFVLLKLLPQFFSDH